MISWRGAQLPNDEIQGYNIYVDGEFKTQVKGSKKTNAVVEDIKPTEVGIRHSILLMLLLSFIDLDEGGFGEILPEVIMLSLITSGHNSPNLPSGASLNDILYRKNDINYAKT